MAFSFLQSLPFLPLAWTSFALDQSVLSGSAAAATCSGRALPKGVVAGAPAANVNITSHGIPRSYLLHVPLGYDATKAAPVYFSFHGAGKNASEQELLTQFSNPVFNPDGIAVYPESLGGKWFSNPNVTHSSPNDLDFISDIVNDLTTNICIDTTRIYAAGKSNGGGLTNALACNATVGSKFAAFASVSGAYYNTSYLPAMGTCDPRTAHTPFIEFHGRQDCIAPYFCDSGLGPCRTSNGHVPQTGVPPIIDQWLTLNQCGPDSKFSSHPGRPAFGGDVLIKSWECAKRSGIVQHYRENNLGHVWPSIAPCNDDCSHIRCPATHRGGHLVPKEPRPDCPAGNFSSQCPQGNYVFNATSEILAFFARYSLPTSRN